MKKLLINENDWLDAKAKDAVLRYLFAYDARVYKEGDEKTKLTIFRTNENYKATGKDERELENAIRNVNGKSDYAYAARIIEELFKFDYVGRTIFPNNPDIGFYGLTRTGAIFISTNGFEKDLLEKYRLGSENFYKVVTLLVALSAIAFPVWFDSSNQLIKPMNEIKISLDSINQNLKSLREPVEENIALDTANVK